MPSETTIDTRWNMDAIYSPRLRTCTFTGHRNLTHAEMTAVEPALRRLITLLADHQVDTFITGGALGFDTLAAATIINLRRTLLPQIKLVLALPCPEQADRWSAADRALYHNIIEHADEVCMVSPAYVRGCMHKRNRYMVDRSSYLIGYVARPSGGSYATLQYAQKQGLHIQNLAPNAVQIK